MKSMRILAILSLTIVLALSYNYVHAESSPSALNIPVGTLEIHSQAFSGVSSDLLVLPSSITYIADDAFDHCNFKRVIAPEGAYAEQWCVDHGLIPTITISYVDREGYLLAEREAIAGRTYTVDETIIPEWHTYRFIGWKLDGEPVTAFKTYGNVTLWPIYERIEPTAVWVGDDPDEDVIVSLQAEMDGESPEVYIASHIEGIDPEQVDIEWQINGTLIDYDRYYDHYSDSVTTYDQETGIGPLLHLYVFTNTKFTHYHIKWYRVVVNGVPSSNKVIYHEHLGNEPFDLCCVYGCVGPVHDIACPMWHPNRILYDGEEIDQIGEELYTVADAPEEREDYRFLGWKCGDVVYQPGDEVYVVYDMWFSSEWEYIGR